MSGFNLSKNISILSYQIHVAIMSFIEKKNSLVVRHWRTFVYKQQLLLSFIKLLFTSDFCKLVELGCGGALCAVMFTDLLFNVLPLFAFILIVLETIHVYCVCLTNVIYLITDLLCYINVVFHSWYGIEMSLVCSYVCSCIRAFFLKVL